MRLSRPLLRSVAGQFTLLGVVFAGGIVLAGVALASRSWFFENFVREKYPETPERIQALLQEFPKREELAKFPREDVERLFEAWIAREDFDPHGGLAQNMLATHSTLIFERVRRTLVAGNPQQRGRAVTLLAWAQGDEQKTEALRLCRWARDRAGRRQEAELAGQAQAVLGKLLGRAK